jgi:battenin
LPSVAGLIGGAVYVNAFTLISTEFPSEGGRQSFALAAASVADSLGIAAADLVAVWVGCWLLRLNGVDGVAKHPAYSS